VHEPIPLFDPQTLTLTLDQDGKLWAKPASGERLPVSARRAFPLSNPSSFVSLVDEQHYERACFTTLTDLPPATRAVLERALTVGEFLPKVRAILSISQEATLTRWQVETDHGPRQFIVDQEDHVRPLSDGRHLISDSHGMRYLVPEPNELDPVSRKWLARFS